MLLSDFNAAKSEHYQRNGWALLLALFVMGVYCALLLTHLERVTTFILHHFAPGVAEIVQGSLLFPLVLILFFTIWFADRKSSRDRRLKCPHCGKRLEGMSSIVIAAKNCPFCGKIVLSEEV